MHAAIIRASQNSPYLAESIELFPELAQRISTEAPGEILKSLFAQISGEIKALETEMAILRVLKRQAHLVIAISDIARIWDWVQVTEHLTQLADFCLKRILASAAKEQNITGHENNPAPGLFVLAVGKYGARELNYSSDVDFNVFYDPEKIRVPDPARAERTIIKLVQNLVKGMEAITEDGYIFRTDLRLRPDPRSNAVAVSTRTAERYYETLGQNWERAAMIKARVCAGDLQAGTQFISGVLEPFIWRKNMDYAAIEDILAMKRQIHAKVGAGKTLKISGHNLKLGFGGIREIEFYTQVQQLILGGRHAELRTPRTDEALSQLANMQFISASDAKIMQEAYDVLRTCEHAVQMIQDQQTHTVPEDEIGQRRFASLMGALDFSALSIELQSVLKDVRQTYNDLFPEAESLSSRAGNMVFTGVEPDPETLEALEKLGYTDGDGVWHDMAAWLGGRVRATRSERAREILTALAPKIIENCADTGQADRAFQSFRQFFTRLGSGISLLSMFNQKPEHLKYVIALMVKSPLMTEWIAQRPAILDALSDPNFLKIDKSAILIGSGSIARADGFETALNSARRWGRETRFRISAAFLSGVITPEQAGYYFSVIAEKIINRLLPFAVQEAALRTGPIKGHVAILGLGKLASQHLNLSSDLDLMLIYKQAPDETNAQSKYTKVTQRLVSALSVVTEEGPLYEVDMALRPSGRSGPVAVTTEAFETYYREKAWSWEFMALTRSRVVAGTSEAFMQTVETLRSEALRAKRPDLNMSADIADMLGRVRREKPARHDLDIKNAVGGLRDIEFIAQKIFLRHRQAASISGVSIDSIIKTYRDEIGGDIAEKLVEIHNFYLELIQYKGVWMAGQDGQLVLNEREAFAKNAGYDSAKQLLDKLSQSKTIIAKIADSLVLNG